MTSAARTKWVGSGPLSTPEIENEEQKADGNNDHNYGYDLGLVWTTF